MVNPKHAVPTLLPLRLPQCGLATTGGAAPRILDCDDSVVTRIYLWSCVKNVATSPLLDPDSPCACERLVAWQVLGFLRVVDDDP